MHTTEQAAQATDRLAAEAGVSATVDGFAGLAPEAILRIQDVPLEGRAGTAFAPVVDGDLVTGPPWTATLPPEVDLICGFMHEEYRFFTGGPGGSDVPPAGLLAHLGLPPGALAAYRAAEPEATDRELVTAIMSDFLFRMPTTWLARAHARAGGRTWL